MAMRDPVLQAALDRIRGKAAGESLCPKHRREVLAELEPKADAGG